MKSYLNFWGDIIIKRNILWGETTCMWLENWLATEKGVRQECVFSPDLFSRDNVTIFHWWEKRH